MPKIETQLIGLVEDFENANKNTFLIYGLSITEYMNQAREKYELEKENMKLARVRNKLVRPRKKYHIINITYFVRTEINLMRLYVMFS